MHHVFSKANNNMKKTPIKKINFTALKKIFSKFPQVKLAYLFGSRATDNYGPMSDYDFAFYLDEKDYSKRFDIRLNLETALSNFLKTDDIDIVIINDSTMPELNYEIINGKLIHEKEPYKVVIEPRIINDFIEFQSLLRQYGLTKA